MKKILILLIGVILVLFYFYNSAEVPLKADGAFKTFIEEMEKRPSVVIPYGEKDLLQKFDERWEYTSPDQIDASSRAANLENLMSKVDSFFYQDIESPGRVKKTLSYVSNVNLFTPQLSVVLSNKNLPANLEVRGIKLFSGEDFNTYSVVVSADKDCVQCEYQTKQILNLLISVNHANVIIDKLILGAVEGSDLGRKRRYFFVDDKKLIHVKNFSSNELGDSYLGFEQYQISGNGVFTRSKAQ